MLCTNRFSVLPVTRRVPPTTKTEPSVTFSLILIQQNTAIETILWHCL